MYACCLLLIPTTLMKLYIGMYACIQFCIIISYAEDLECKICFCDMVGIPALSISLSV